MRRRWRPLSRRQQPRPPLGSCPRLFTPPLAPSRCAAAQEAASLRPPLRGPRPPACASPLTSTPLPPTPRFSGWRRMHDLSTNSGLEECSAGTAPLLAPHASCIGAATLCGIRAHCLLFGNNNVVPNLRSLLLTPPLFLRTPLPSVPARTAGRCRLRHVSCTAAASSTWPPSRPSHACNSAPTG